MPILTIVAGLAIGSLALVAASACIAVVQAITSLRHSAASTPNHSLAQAVVTALHFDAD